MTIKNNLILASALALAGCGTVFNGSVQSITFSSNVKDLQIYANGALVCSSTPCSVDVDRASSAMTIIAKADGYEDNISQIKTKINPVSWGNLLSPYSWTTDFATSSMWKYSRDGVYINMKPKNMKHTQVDTFKNKSNIRHFVLITYPELKLEAASAQQGEYTTSLAQLSTQSPQSLQTIINQADDEVSLAHQLTGIK